MIYKIEYSIPSREDLKESVFYISHKLQNNIAAHKLTDEIDKILHILSETPKRSPIIRDSFLAMYGIRLVRIKNYLLFYIVDEETKSVYILRFLYSHRDWINILKSDMKEGNFS